MTGKLHYTVYACGPGTVVSPSHSVDRKGAWEVVKRAKALGCTFAKVSCEDVRVWTAYRDADGEWQKIAND